MTLQKYPCLPWRAKVSNKILAGWLPCCRYRGRLFGRHFFFCHWLLSDIEHPFVSDTTMSEISDRKAQQMIANRKYCNIFLFLQCIQFGLEYYPLYFPFSRCRLVLFFLLRLVLVVLLPLLMLLLFPFPLFFFYFFFVFFIFSVFAEFTQCSCFQSSSVVPGSS